MSRAVKAHLIAMWAVLALGGLLAFTPTATAQRFGLTSLVNQVTGTLPFGNGGTGLASAADDTTLVSSGSAWAAKTLPSCANATTSKLLYDQSTNSYSCGTDQTGSTTPGGSSGNIQTNNGSGGFGAYAGSACNAGEAVLSVSASGVATCATRIHPLTILQRTTNQSLTNSAFTVVSWDTSAVRDDISAFSSGSPTLVTVPSGYTRVRVNVKVEFANTFGGNRIVQINKNSGTIIDAQGIPAIFQAPGHLVSQWLTVAATNTLKIEIFQDTGGTLNLIGASPSYGGTLVMFEWAQ